MEKNRSFKRTLLLVSGITLALSLLLLSLGLSIRIFPLFIISLIVCVISFVLLISSLCINIKEYNYNGIKIEVYAGFENHYLYINDKLVDEFVSSFSLSSITLNGEYLDNKVVAIVTLDNSINLKVNDKPVKPIKK